MEEQNIELNLLVNAAAVVLHNTDSPTLYMAILSLFASYYYLCPRFTFSQWVSQDKKRAFLKKRSEKKVCFCFLTSQAPLKVCFLKWEAYCKPMCWLPDPQIRLSDFQKLLAKIIKTRVVGQVTVYLVIRWACKSLTGFFPFKNSHVWIFYYCIQESVFDELLLSFKVVFKTEQSSKNSAAEGRAF